MFTPIKKGGTAEALGPTCYERDRFVQKKKAEEEVKNER